MTDGAEDARGDRDQIQYIAVRPAAAANKFLAPSSRSRRSDLNNCQLPVAGAAADGLAETPW